MTVFQLPFLLGVPIVLTIDWANISGGNLAIIASLFVIAGFFFRYAPGQSAALQTAREAAESFRDLAESRALQLEEMRQEHASLNEAIELGKDDIRAAVDRLHHAEIEVKEREKVIAELQARPDTKEMLAVFEAHHQENLERTDRLVEAIDKLIGMQGDVHAILQTLAFDPDRPKRRTDP